MIPRWLLVAIVLAALGVFISDYAAQFLVTDYKSNPAIITTFGAIAGMAFVLARSSDKRDKEDREDKEDDRSSDSVNNKHEQPGESP